MQNNAILSLLLVILIGWVFLGSGITLVVALGLIFALAGTFGVLHFLGITLSIPVLVGTVIVLGMLVDDGVVVSESINYQMQKGFTLSESIIITYKEVFTAVTASVLTTIVAFLPLMLLPGILGKFTFLIPLVVSIALLISIVEVFWLLPSHLICFTHKFSTLNLSKKQPFKVHWRIRFMKKIRFRYSKCLIIVLRRPKLTLSVALLSLVMAVTALTLNLVNINFFAFSNLRIFYLQIDMPPGTPINMTLDKAILAANKIEHLLNPDEVRAVTATAGMKFTSEDEYYGPEYGQVIISLNPTSATSRSVTELINTLKPEIEPMFDKVKLSFMELHTGPPISAPIKVKVLGDDYAEIQSAVTAIMQIINNMNGTLDIENNDVFGRPQINLILNKSRIKNAGLSPDYISRLLRLHVDGEVAGNVRYGGDIVEIRVKAKKRKLVQIELLLEAPISLPDGRIGTLGQFVDYQLEESRLSVSHYNYKKAVTIEAKIDENKTNTLRANKDLINQWEKIQHEHPRVSINLTGEWDDIYESINGLAVLFILGCGLIYLILVAKFRSYYQPFIVLLTVPFGFIGVIFGLVVTNNPLSLFTLYGIVALMGIVVNSAIVFVSATNQRLVLGISPLYAVFFAARRRVVAIIITSVTTVGGLLSLALGLGGASLVWGPMAMSIVSGISIATVMTIFVVPIITYLTLKK